MKELTKKGRVHNDCVLSRDERIFMSRVVRGSKLWELQLEVIPAEQLSASDRALTVVQVHLQPPGYDQHERLGHLGLDTLARLAKQEVIPKLSPEDETAIKACSACKQAKLTRRSFPPVSNSVQATSPMEVRSADSCGPMPVLSRSGKKYVLVIVDNATRFWQVRFLSRKDNATKQLKSFQAWGERVTGKKMRALHTDGGVSSATRTCKRGASRRA